MTLIENVYISPWVVLIDRNSHWLFFRTRCYLDEISFSFVIQSGEYLRQVADSVEKVSNNSASSFGKFLREPPLNTSVSTIIRLATCCWLLELFFLEVDLSTVEYFRMQCQIWFSFPLEWESLPKMSNSIQILDKRLQWFQLSAAVFGFKKNVICTWIIVTIFLVLL